MRSRVYSAISLVMVAAMLMPVVVGCGTAATPTAEPVPTSAPVGETPAAQPPEATPTEAPPPEPVVVAQAVDALSLDPNVYTDMETFNIGWHIYDGLISRDKNMQIAPGLAESWETSEDGLTWTFHIRHGVKTHNGADFKAEQIKSSLERMMASPRKQMFFAAIDSIRVVDDYTLEIVTKAPTPTLTLYLAFVAFLAPSDYVDEVGEEEFGRNPVGTGPYKVVEWVKDERIVLEANEDYWGEVPEIKTVIFKPIPEASTRIAELLTGAVDVVAHVPIQDIQRVNDSPNAEIVTKPGTSLWFIRLRTDQEPLDDVRVRQAMNYAVDVDAVVENVLGGYGVRLNGVVPSHAFGYAPDVTWPYEYDPDKARDLLASAGYPDGFSVKFDLSSDLLSDRKEAIDVIVAQLADVGIDVELVINEPAVYAEKYKGKALEGLSVEGLSGPTFDADVLYSQFFHSKSYKAYWHPAEVEELIDKAGSTMDEAERLGYYEELAKIVAAEAPIIPMYVAEEIYGKSTRLDWEPRTDQQILMMEASLK